MGLITRSEAAHRLKIIASHLFCAITAARKGEWEACSNAAVEVSDLLDAIRPHLAEADEAFTAPPVGNLKYNPPAPDKTDHAFGYSGSASTRSKKVDPNGIYAGMNANQRVEARVANATSKPPAPIAFAPPSVKFATEPRVLVTPPPAALQPKASPFCAERNSVDQRCCLLAGHPCDHVFKI